MLNIKFLDYLILENFDRETYSRLRF